MAFTGQKTVTTAGTRVAIGTGTARLIRVRALAGNAGVVYVGDVTVSSTVGYELSAGESCLFEPPDYEIASVYADSAENGDKVCFAVVEGL